MKVLLTIIALLAMNFGITQTNEVRNAVTALEKDIEELTMGKTAWETTFIDDCTIRLEFASIEGGFVTYTEDIIYLDRLRPELFKMEKGEYTIQFFIYFEDDSGELQNWRYSSTQSLADKITKHFEGLHKLCTK